MRKDMSKVIVERPRTGGRVRRKGRTDALLGADDAPLRQRAPRREPERTKSLNENLAPLRRYLEANAGRPWDKVRSEIGQHLRITNAVQKHVFDHIEDFVVVKTAMRDGKVMIAPGAPFGRGWRAVSDSRFRLYVHPKSGLLLKNPALKVSRRRGSDAPDTRRRDVGPMRQAHLFRDGAWWDVVLERIPHRVKETILNGRVVKEKIPLSVRDEVLERGLSSLAPRVLYGRDGVYAVSVHRLTRLERKRLDLP